MSNETMAKFGWPHSEIAAYAHWTVLARPKQVTLGSLVLVNRSQATAFAAVGAAAFAELGLVIADIEATLSRLWGYDKINYLMLMMVDPQVHFHVLPRYRGPRTFAGRTFSDPAWPGPPNLAVAEDLSADDLTAIQNALKAAWPKLP
ncbi:MAG: HIT family protein [Sphingomonadales bacterium]|nr:HIT family protein [Sphingomonadales bacterium]